MTMVSKRRRFQIYTNVFDLFMKLNIYSLPVLVEQICYIYGIKLVKLSEITKNTGLSKKDVFNIWRNEDGQFESSCGNFKIAYNNRKPITKIRFTVAHELGHFFLKHYLNPKFSIFSPVFDELVYERYEEEANIFGGMLLCPPPIFYEMPVLNSPKDISDICYLGDKCASVRYSVLNTYRNEIRSHFLYDCIATLFDEYMHSLPCPICGYTSISPMTGLCQGCESSLDLPQLSVYHQ